MKPVCIISLDFDDPLHPADVVMMEGIDVDGLIRVLENYKQRTKDGDRGVPVPAPFILEGNAG